MDDRAGRRLLFTPCGGAADPDVEQGPRMRDHPRPLPIAAFAVLAAGLVLGGCSGMSLPSFSGGREPAPPPTAASAPVQIRPGRADRPLGLHVLSERGRPGPHRQHGARPVPQPLRHCPRPERRRDDASRRPAPAERTAPEGQLRRQELHRAGRRGRRRAGPGNRLVRRPRADRALRRSRRRQPLRQQVYVRCAASGRG